MPREQQSLASLRSKENCGICGNPLTYAVEPVSMDCVFCAESHSALMYCPEGHYICDSCHQLEAIDALRYLLESTKSSDPLEILESVMSHPSVSMHGPEHHAMVPAAIVAAVRNAGHTVPDGAIEEALSRGAKVPGGWCGFYGACGGALGVGIAVSVLNRATPLTGKERSLANEATAFALSKMLDGHPRCCKRESRNGVEAAVEFLRERMGVALTVGQPLPCHYSERNRECPKAGCYYYTARQTAVGQE